MNIYIKTCIYLHNTPHTYIVRTYIHTHIHTYTHTHTHTHHTDIYLCEITHKPTRSPPDPLYIKYINLIQLTILKDRNDVICILKQLHFSILHFRQAPLISPFAIHEPPLQNSVQRPAAATIPVSGVSDALQIEYGADFIPDIFQIPFNPPTTLLLSVYTPTTLFPFSRQ